MVWQFLTPDDKTLKSNISKTVRDREMVSIKVNQEVIYRLSNGFKLFDHSWPLEGKGQGQILKTVKSNIPITVRDREKVSIEDFDVERLENTSR